MRASTAQVHPSAHLAEGVSIGHFTVIGPRVTIGPRTTIGHHVVIHDGSQIGADVRIDDHAVIGKQPMRAAASATTEGRCQSPARVGTGCIVGTSAIVYAGCALAVRVMVADLATVREDVHVGERTIIGRGVAVENHCRIGARCKLETNAYLCAYSTVGDDCFVAPGVLTSNDNFLGRDPERYQHFKGITVERGGRLGVGAVCLPGRTVNEEGVVGAGAVLTKDAPARAIVVGIPAQPFREVPMRQLLRLQEGE